MGTAGQGKRQARKTARKRKCPRQAQAVAGTGQTGMQAKKEVSRQRQIISALPHRRHKQR